MIGYWSHLSEGCYVACEMTTLIPVMMVALLLLGPTLGLVPASEINPSSTSLNATAAAAAAATKPFIQVDNFDVIDPNPAASGIPVINRIPEDTNKVTKATKKSKKVRKWDHHHHHHHQNKHATKTAYDPAGQHNFWSNSNDILSTTL